MAVNQRRTREGARRSRRGGRSIDGAGDRDLPTIRSADEQPLRDPAVLVAAPADSIPIGSVDEAGLDAAQVKIVRLDRVRPMLPSRLGKVLIAGRESGRATTGQSRRVQVVREVLVAIALPDGVDVRFED